MYNIYQTKGWVLGGVEIGEANRFLDIFTDEFGLVRGMAQSVRKIDSKLRYGLQDYSFSKISLVRGRLFWRVVGAERLDDFKMIDGNGEKLRLVGRIFLLLRRLIKGEERDSAVFEDIERAMNCLSRLDGGEFLSSFEAILVFRILNKLGYVPRSASLDYLADFREWESRHLDLGNEDKAMLLRQINSSLAHSHL